MYVYKITCKEYGTKKRRGLRRDPLGDMNSFLWWGDKESHWIRERSGSRTLSETRLWWKLVEEKISGREQSVVCRVARFSKIKNVQGSCTVARRHWEPGGEQMLR